MLQLPKSWNSILQPNFHSELLKKIEKFLSQEIAAGKTIYPKEEDIFAAFEHTTPESLKVVILGQDPYHGAGQAHGLSFSVQEGVKTPPSLKNIYKELASEYPDYTIPEHGNLEHWADQGVLLLNSILTVEAGNPASHSKLGWETFTDSVISSISESMTGIIFVLWGNYSKKKKVLINSDKHFILESAHPSPFSARNGFFGNNHFLKINEILREQGKSEIRW